MTQVDLRPAEDAEDGVRGESSAPVGRLNSGASPFAFHFLLLTVRRLTRLGEPGKGQLIRPWLLKLLFHEF